MCPLRFNSRIGQSAAHSTYRFLGRPWPAFPLSQQFPGGGFVLCLLLRRGKSSIPPSRAPIMRTLALDLTVFVSSHNCPAHPPPPLSVTVSASSHSFYSLVFGFSVQGISLCFPLICQIRNPSRILLTMKRANKLVTPALFAIGAVAQSGSSILGSSTVIINPSDTGIVYETYSICPTTVVTATAPTMTCPGPY